jgi:hypothetical protein
VYLLDLPTDMQLRPVINVKDLTAYQGQLQEASSPKSAVKLPSSMKPCKEIEDILNDQIVSTWCGSY